MKLKCGVTCPQFIFIFSALIALDFAYGLRPCIKSLGEFSERDQGEAGVSMGSISVIEGQVNMWSAMRSESDSKLQLQLGPNQPAVIGRLDGGRPPYLDEAYTSTQLMPGGGRVVRGHPDDVKVSRAHFMLKYHAKGILIVNGVPSEGGGIRAPVNGTELITSTSRKMDPGEEYLVEHGKNARLRLPNGTTILINAE